MSPPQWTTIDNMMIFDCQQPFLRRLLRPGTAITRFFHLHRELESITQHLVAVHDDTVFKMRTHSIKGKDIICSIIQRIRNKLHLWKPVGQINEPFCPIPRNDIDFLDAHPSQPLNQPFQQRLSSYDEQRLRRLIRPRTQARSASGRQQDGPFHPKHFMPPTS